MPGVNDPGRAYVPAEWADIQRRLTALENKQSPQSAPTTITTFANGWRTFTGVNDPTWGLARYYKTSEGLVVVEGLIDKNGGNFVSGETMFTLPVGFRPVKQGLFGQRMQGGASSVAQGRVDFTAGGAAVLVDGAPSNPVAYVTLFGIAFETS